MKAKIQEKIDTNPDVWGAREVAQYLKMAQKTVYLLARKGDIPCTILGEKIFRFSREKIVNLI